MNSLLLSDLAHLFTLEAHHADMRGDAEEAERLWEIAQEIFERALRLPPQTKR
jgi:hypothetical protein